jgi:filamentous hemagglutinin
MFNREHPRNPGIRMAAGLTGLLLVLGLVLQPAAASAAAEVVQIAAPSAAGISRNQYNSFNVGPNGLVLNNSAAAVSTQLAGTIAGNANLQAGPARIILNEVTGTSASQIRGFIEVAGQRADVIVANPNGIVVDGGGFINAGRAVLTTGRPVFGGCGSLLAFRVSGGQIGVQGAGLDATGIDRVDLISRTMAVTAAVRANELNAIAGANTVRYSTLSARPLTGAAPGGEIAIDVGALGGMYAGKIKLIATERGVGVNSQGVISATGGDIAITSAGKVVLANRTSATGAIAVDAKAIDLSGGMMFADGAVALKAGEGGVTNTAFGFVNAGGAITVTTPGSFVNTTGGMSAGGAFTVKAASLDNTSGFLSAGGAFAIDLGSFVSYGGHKGYYGHGGCGSHYTCGGASAKPVVTAGFFDNTAGFLSAGGNLALTVRTTADTARYAVENTNGYISAGSDMTVAVTAAAAKSGKCGEPAAATVNALNNTDGYIGAGNNIAITAQDATAAAGGHSGKCGSPCGHTPAPAPSKTSYFVNNTRGLISAGNDIIVAVQGTGGTAQYSSYGRAKYSCGHNFKPAPAAPFTIDNTAGTFAALGDLVITTKGSVNNGAGWLTAAGSAAVSADTLKNTQGTVSGDSSVTILTRLPFDRQAGQVNSNGPIVISTI